MSSTPEDAVPHASPEAAVTDGPTDDSQRTGSDVPNVAAAIVGAEAVAMTPEGQEIAPLRAKYPTRGNGWMLLGVLFFVVAGLFLMADVEVSQRAATLTNVQQCGTLLSPRDPAESDWVGACDDARSQRVWLVGVPAALGVASIVGGAWLRKRRP